MVHRVVIVGGGFAGLNAVRALRRAPVEITLVDRRNHHLFQPLLYQVATGSLSPANIAAPLRNLLKRQQNAQVLLGEVTDIDVARRQLRVEDGRLSYDTLILAAGSSHSYFGRNEWSALAPGLKSIENATSIRSKILVAFEEAERTPSQEEMRRLLTFVIVGGGPTGVELAGSVADISRHTLRSEFRSIDPADARILLVEAGDRVLSNFAPELSEAATRGLARLGVEVMLGGRVTDIEPDHVVIQRGGETLRIDTRNVIWAAGVEASPLGRLVAQATGVEADRAGRVHVAPDLTVPGHPEIFIIGDMAYYPHDGGQPLPALAPVAMQQGMYVAKLIRSQLTHSPPPPKFHYRDYGTMAQVGRGMAVVDIHGWRFAGAFAWLLWLFVHLLQIVQFESRVLVLIQWAWHYVTRNRSARLITGEDVARVHHPEADPFSGERESRVASPEPAGRTS